MDRLIQALLVLHFVGLAMGFSVSFGNMVMAGLIERAAPAERAILGRFPPALSRIGRWGLALLWLSGLALVFFKWDGFSGLPWTFHVKLTAAVLVTAISEHIRVLERRAASGDLAAAARIPRVGPLAGLFALVALVFAVLTFD